MNYRIEIVTKLDEHLIKEWQKLWDRAENANIYNSYEWFLTSVETNNIKEYEIYLCYRDNVLVAILPLEKYKCFDINVTGTINRNHMVDTGFLMEKYDKTIFKYLFGNVMNKNIYLQKIDSRAAAILHEMYPKALFSLISVNPYIPLTGDTYETVSKTTLERLRKIIKKNEGQLRLEIYRDDLQKHLKTMLKLQESSSKKERSMDVFEKEEIKNYYQNLIKYCTKFVNICILYLGKTPISYEFGFEYHGIYLGDQISYHNEYKKYVPGKMMVYFLMEELKKLGLKIIDQGGGISDYKMSFSEDYNLYYNVYFSQNPIIMSWWKLVNKARRIRQVANPKKYTRDHEFLFKTL